MAEIIPQWLCPAISRLIALRNETDAEEQADGHESGDCCPDEVLTCFECVQIPEFDVVDYVGFLYATCPTMTVWVRSLVLLDDFVRASGIKVSSYTLHRLIVSSLIATSVFLGNGKEGELSWGIDQEELRAMIETFDRVLEGSYHVSFASCIDMMLPFTSMHPASILAARLLRLEGSETEDSSERKIERWVSEAVAPPAGAIATTATSVLQLFRRSSSREEVLGQHGSCNDYSTSSSSKDEKPAVPECPLPPSSPHREQSPSFAKTLKGSKPSFQALKNLFKKAKREFY
eukprot:TRINITY_DN14849_c0_g1_i1.p1 TRINITY_DN14849_c0_g1~~TRINITY_DN14849_c0_g1_i1.p1  ORF type:complete len:316 (+),score=138.88 TRINITY_DN14849_c0_g1_i1:82-948(+)